MRVANVVRVYMLCGVHVRVRVCGAMFMLGTGARTPARLPDCARVRACEGWTHTHTHTTHMHTCTYTPQHSKHMPLLYIMHSSSCCCITAGASCCRSPHAPTSPRPQIRTAQPVAWKRCITVPGGSCCMYLLVVQQVDLQAVDGLGDQCCCCLGARQGDSAPARLPGPTQAGPASHSRSAADRVCTGRCRASRWGC